MKYTPLHPNRVSLWIEYLNLLFLRLVKIFLLVTRRLKEERRRVVGENDACGEGLQPLDIMLEPSH
jgi:hypothetical protein